MRYVGEFMNSVRKQAKKSRATSLPVTPVPSPVHVRNGSGN
jgi:hypothetical protein